MYSQENVENIGTINDIPTQTGWGVAEKERHMLFVTLPASSVTSGIVVRNDIAAWANPYQNQKTAEVQLEENTERELGKVHQMRHLLDLRNADKGGINFENRRRIVVAFSTPKNPFDPGRPEVQGTL